MSDLTDETLVRNYLDRWDARVRRVSENSPVVARILERMGAALRRTFDTEGAAAGARAIAKWVNNEVGHDLILGEDFLSSERRRALGNSIRPRAVIAAYTMRHHESYEHFCDADSGDVHIERQGTFDEDKWGIRVGYSDARLSRDAIGWRERNPDAPFHMFGDNQNVAPPERREIRRMFNLPSLPSNRPCGWNEEHQFTLAEACYVCGIEVP